MSRTSHVPECRKARAWAQRFRHRPCVQGRKIGALQSQSGRPRLLRLPALLRRLELLVGLRLDRSHLLRDCVGGLLVNSRLCVWEFIARKDTAKIKITFESAVEQTWKWMRESGLDQSREFDFSFEDDLIARIG